MAFIKNDSINGLVGNVVIYKLNGKGVVRTRPLGYKTTKASKEAARIFGKASEISASRRGTLHRAMHDTRQPSMRYRFDKAIAHWLRNSKPDSQSPEHRFFLIDKFQFNDKCSTTDHLKVQLSVDWTPEDKIKIIIPALIPVRDIYAPPYTSSIEWFIQLSSIPLHAYTTNYIESTTFSMPYDEKPVAEKILELQFRHRPGHFSIAFFSLRFTLTRGSQSIVMQDEEWTPAGVIGSHYVEEIKK